MSMEELANVKGRGWDDVDVSDSPTEPSYKILTPHSIKQIRSLINYDSQPSGE